MVRPMDSRRKHCAEKPGKLPHCDLSGEVPVKIAFGIEPRDVAPCSAVHPAKLLVVYEEIRLLVIDNKPNVN